MPKSYEDKGIQSAYNSIHNFFDVCNLEHAIKYTNTILTSAMEDKVWRKETPSNLLFYMENFSSLYAAAFAIHYNYTKRTEAVIDPPKDNLPDISITENFMDGQYYNSCVWYRFPRHFSARQYHDPYKGIKKFCTYMAHQEWINYLKDVIECALSKNTLDEVYHSYNIITVRVRIMKLIEACHLIDVRCNRKKSKSSKRKK